MSKIKYSCTNCGIWETSITAEWSDIKPKRCMNKKCNTSFITNPDALKTELPQKVEAVPQYKSKRYKKNEQES